MEPWYPASAKVFLAKNQVGWFKQKRNLMKGYWIREMLREWTHEHKKRGWAPRIPTNHTSKHALPCLDCIHQKGLTSDLWFFLKYLDVLIRICQTRSCLGNHSPGCVLYNFTHHTQLLAPSSTPPQHGGVAAQSRKLSNRSTQLITVLIPSWLHG